MFWPLTHNLFGTSSFEVYSMTSVVVELGLFFVTVPFMYKFGDMQTLLKPHNINWALIIPIGAVLGPLLAVGRGQESSLPIFLAIPSLFYVILFAYSILIELRARLNQDKNSVRPHNS